MVGEGWWRELPKNKYQTPKFKEGFGLIYSKTRSLQRLRTKKRDNLSTLSRLVPEVGIEPTLLAEHEFESCASTNSAIRANGERKSTSEFTISPRRSGGSFVIGFSIVEFARPAF